MNFENEETVVIFDVESNDMCFQAPISADITDEFDFLAKFDKENINVKMFGDVPSNSFKKITNLKEIDLTLSNRISNDAFYGLSSLMNVIVSKPLVIESSAFYNCKNASGEITISESQTTIEDNTFRSCENLKINLHDNIIKIGSYSFYRCSLLETEKLPSKLLELGTYAFQNSGIKIKEIPEGIQKIPNYCFFQCNSIETLQIGDNVTVIDTYAFRYCNNLKSVEIGTGITKLNNYSFGNCTNLESITMHALKPPTISSLNTFYNDSNLKEIRVPLSVLETYKSYTGWSNYADIMVGIEGE